LDKKNNEFKSIKYLLVIIVVYTIYFSVVLFLSIVQYIEKILKIKINNFYYLQL